MLIRNLLNSLLGLTIIISTGYSNEVFTKSDNWCAIGDSITHGGSYHKYISTSITPQGSLMQDSICSTME